LPPIVNAKEPVGFFVHLVRPVVESALQPEAVRNFLYAASGM
jgi:hypothetical protein